MDVVLEQFLSEARENLSFLDRNLQNLKNNEPDELNALFRAAHTLKGGAGLVGLESVKTITHHAEDLLDGIKKGKIVYTDEMLDILYDAFDEIVEMIDATEEQGEVPLFDNQRVEKIANSVKVLINIDDASDEKYSLDTDLNIQENFEVQFAELISSHNLNSFIHELPFELKQIDQEFIENENFYLLDMDIDEQCCSLGNDPVYLAYLLGEENIYSVSTFVYCCDDLKEDPKLWKTRLTMVVKASKEELEDCLYNVIDDVVIYPLTIRSLIVPSYESQENDIFDDFLLDLKQLISQGEFSLLSEKLSAASKILNPLSKEGFILSRLEVVLPCFEFEGIDYLELIKFISLVFNLENSSCNVYVNNQESSTEEIQTVINSLEQQIKVVEFAKDDMALSRAKLHAKSSLEFINLEANFSVDDTKEELITKISSYILELKKGDELPVEETFDTVVSKHTFDEYKTENNNETIIEDKSAQKEVFSENIKQKVTVPKTVKIDQSDIDSMMDIIGELLVMKNSLPYIANSITQKENSQSKIDLINKYEEINRVTEQLQDIVMGMRLLPLSYIFSRYPKLVRELSKKLGKKIRFEESGADTKLDKMMIEKIADPLVHLIRNSIDHGIELNEEERIKNGKEIEGFIKITAKSIGDKVQILIEDDGRGIDVQKVLLKALELGIVTEEKIESMDEQEKLQMIFNPGLSTAEKITDLSGRGVGTDAVKKTIEELNGNIYLESSLNIGTKVTIEVPVSVALVNVFCVKMNENNYAISMENVLETIKVASSDIQVANRKKYVRLRGEIIPLVFESRLLPSNQEEMSIQSVVIIQTPNLRYGLVVNEFINQLDVVQKPLEGALCNHPIISGTSLLGNGEILFILDTNNIVA